MAFIKQGYDRKCPFSVFGYYLFDSEPTLSEVIKAVGWISNRLIYNGSVKIDTPKDFSELKQIKNYRIVKDPEFRIGHNTLIAKGKGRGRENIVLVKILPELWNK